LSAPAFSLSDRSAAARVRRVAAGALALATLAALAATPAAAQYFGRNRAVRARFQWQVLRTAHCNVNFYQGEEAAARAIGRRAEQWYGRLAAAFGAAPDGRIEVLVYANLADFQQTTLTPERLDPDRGPLDPRRRRLRLPLTGDGDHDDHQLGHELVQIFQQELQGRRRVREAVAGAIGRQVVPLWMDDGLADYLAAGRDSVVTAMWLRDALPRGMLPDLAVLGTLPRDVGERWGHAFWAFVGGRFGDRAAMQLYVELTRRGVGGALQQVLRLDERQVVSQWHAAIDAAYGRFVAARSAAAGGAAGGRGGDASPEAAGPAGRAAGGAGGGGGGDGSGGRPWADGGGAVPGMGNAGGAGGAGGGEAWPVGWAGARRIPRGQRSTDRYLSPALSPDGSRVAYFSTRGLFGLDLDLADAATGERIGRLFSSGAERGFDALRFADSAASWSPDGRQLALTMFHGGEDRIALLDAAGGGVERQIVVPGAGALSDPAWSPDGGSIAVVGSQGGTTALWLVQVASGAVRRLTDGCGGAVRQPAWSPDGRTLAFACQGGPVAGAAEWDGGRFGAAGGVGGTGGEGVGGAVGDARAGGAGRAGVADGADGADGAGGAAGASGDGNRGGGGSGGVPGEKGVEMVAAGPWRIRLLDMPAGQRSRPAMPAAAGAGSDQIDPRFGPGAGDLYFLSDRGGVRDVYRWDLAAGGLFQVTAVTTGVAGVTARSPALAVAAHSGRLMFTVFAAGSWEIHDLEAGAARGAAVAAGPAAGAAATAIPGAGAARLSLLPPATETSSLAPLAAGQAPGASSSAGAATAAGAPPKPSQAAGEPGSAAAAGSTGGAAVGGPATGGGVAGGAVAGGAAGAAAAPDGDGSVVPYRSRLALEDVSPGLGVGYSSLGYAVGADISARLGDVVDHYQISADVQGGISAFPEYGGSILFLDTAAPLQWGVQVGHVPSVSGFAQVEELPAGSGAPGPPAALPSIAIDQIFELITQDQVELLLQYPFSPTERLQASVSYNHLGFAAKDVRQVLTGTQVVQTSRFNLPDPASLTLYQGGLALIGDTSLMGDTSPVRGQRYRAEVSASTGDLSFEQVTADYRRYFLFRPLTLAVRALHLGRYGDDANSPSLLPLFIGDPTLVRGYELGSLSASECRPPSGAPNTCPQFDRLVGSRLAVVNLELRLPLFGKSSMSLFELRLLPTELALFVDAGTAWSAHQPPVLHLSTDSDSRIPVASTGVAARFLVAGVAVAQVYVAKPFERPQRGTVTGIVISPGW
jgi:Tol biopolymer transport system component